MCVLLRKYNKMYNPYVSDLICTVQYTGLYMKKYVFLVHSENVKTSRNKKFKKTKNVF